MDPRRHTRHVTGALGRAAFIAQDYGQGPVRPEHILLALIAGNSRAAGALREVAVDPDAIRERIETLGRFPPRRDRPEGSRSVSIRFTSDADEVLRIALEEANARGSRPVGTEDLLLALLRAKDGIVARALEAEGVVIEDLRKRITLGSRRVSSAERITRDARAFARAFDDLLASRGPVWHVVGRDRERLVEACIDWLTPERVRALETSNEADRAAWILDRLLPLGEVELFRRLNSYERWLYTLYPLFRRSPADMDSVTPERFSRGESSAAEAAWVETRATDDELLGWHAECLRRGWPDGTWGTLAAVEYCRRTPDRARIVAYLEEAPGKEVPVLLHCLMRLVAGSVPTTARPEVGLADRLREAGLEAEAEAVARHTKADPSGPLVIEFPIRTPHAVHESELADALWVEQQTDPERLVGVRSSWAPARLARITPRDGAAIWKRAFEAQWFSNDELMPAFCSWCTPADRQLLVEHFDHEDVECAVTAFHTYLALATPDDLERLAGEARWPWQVESLDRWLHAPAELRPQVGPVRRPHEIVFDLRRFDPFDVTRDA